MIKPPFPEWLIADPTVLTPDSSPDGKWHLFAHGILGIYHYSSFDGIHWKRISGVVSWLSLRPFIYFEKKKYYLVYEKINSPFHFPHYNSHLELVSSDDLIHWSRPVTILEPSHPWHRTKNKIGNVGNPSLVKVRGEYRLYYSSGLIEFPDTFFCEPAFQGLATSEKITGPYHLQKKPLIRKNSSSTNLISATRIVSTPKGFLGLYTLFHTNPLSKISTSSLHFSHSADGLKWTMDKKPIITPGQSWKRTHVYIGSLVKKFNGEWRIYYNARKSHSFFGQEAIGLAIAK